MPKVDLGTVADVSWDAGQAGLTVTLTVTRPDGTVVTPTVTATGSVYASAVPTPIAGEYHLRWTSTTKTSADVLHVWPANPRLLLPLDTIYAYIGISKTAARDDLFRLYSAVATNIIEKIVGSVLVREVEQYSDGGKTGIALWERPQADTVRVWLLDTELTIESDFVVNANSGIVWAGNRSARGTFPLGNQNLRVTYTTQARLTPSIELAARQLVKRQYELNNQASHADWTSPNPDEETVETADGYAIPKSVHQLLMATPKLPGF